MKQYDVYGYYSSSEHGRPGQYLETFETKQRASEFVEDFERIQGRLAWIEEQTLPIRQ